MGEQTNIGWTEKTWNPWHGCHKISPGCKFCYMFRDKLRYGQDPNVVVRSKTTFKDPLKWAEPSMIFTCSWSDWFIEEADPWRAEAWDIIRATPRHTYQILTKRPERIKKHLPSGWGRGWPNVWLGVSVENQEQADKRIPYLLEVRAAVRWLSCEPLLGRVDLTRIPTGLWTYGRVDVMSGYLGGDEPDSMYDWDADPNGWVRKPAGEWERGPHGVDWVVFGGESGSDRVMSLKHLRAGVDQCTAAGVPVFVKQDSGLRPGLQGRIPDAYWLKQFPS